MYRAVPGIFLMSILVLNAHAQSTNQSVLTNEDRKEILSILFERELAALDGKELIVQFSPRTNAHWLLDRPGVRFERVRYEEEKQVSEYYELHETKTRRNSVEVWFSKGNYCKKVGTIYEFRKEDGKWTAKTPRFTESYTAGTECVGCKTGSGSVYTWKNKTAQPNEPKTLLLTGKALAIRCRRNETKYIRCEVDLSLDFSNRGNQPITILQPHGEYEFWLGARLLALTKADSEANNYVYSSAGWPSFSDSEEHRLLIKALDQPTPPAELTRTIGPNESWTWTTTMQLAVAEENTCSGSVGVEIGWKQIKKLSAPVWLKVSYEMWPFFKNFKNAHRYWRDHLTSEPIELDFQAVELK